MSKALRKLPDLKLSKNALAYAYEVFVFLIYKIQFMKNDTPTHAITLNAVLKFVGEAFKSLFESNNNREFKRLKNFIAS
jgi:hypothetical protein